MQNRRQWMAMVLYFGGRSGALSTEETKAKRESSQTKGQGGRKQSFREAWLEQDEFKGWLAPDPSGNSQRAFCKACGTTITTAGSELRRHAGAPSHKKATAGLQKQNFIHPSVLERGDINPMDPSCLLPLEDVYLGSECNEALGKCKSDGMQAEAHNLRVRCLCYYQTGAVEIKKRLPVSGLFFHEVQFVASKTALSADARRQLPALPTLQMRYAHLLPAANEVEQEWRMLPSYSKDEKSALEAKSSASFWADIGELKSFRDNWQFQNIATLAQLI
ncbi:hypothetical protein HPB49_008292 [Dermacentor silvarum]|uniref:Uncharacterized protein n=1 Tax=Dermacentor silvarum TaxID=543639 RepID=A0ACB8DXX5_DERSI|nr:hypothetical protein HPB49_008292 [Dermacentor silvarum]